jgi:hypothetical protein
VRLVGVHFLRAFLAQAWAHVCTKQKRKKRQLRAHRLRSLFRQVVDGILGLFVGFVDI